MLPQVIKRDGTKEKFSLINIAKVVTAAGVSPEEARLLSERIEIWATQQAATELTSLQIRDKVLEELLSINKNAAELYKWYEQSKDI